MDNEAPRKKKWHEIIAALTPLILGIAVTGVGAVFTHVYNYRQLQLNQIDALDKFRGLLVSDKSYDREFAYAAFAALGYEELAFKIIQIKQDTAGRSVVEEIKRSGSAVSKEVASAALTSIPARVFVQIASENQRATANSIVSELKQYGFEVPGVENIAGKADIPESTSVRYFNAEDKPVAEGIAELLRKKGVTDAHAENVNRFKVKPGSLEVWFSAGAL